MIMRKSNDDTKGLEGLFYIIDKTTKDSDNEWWQLRLKESHYVMSAVSSREQVEECLYNICRRYKTQKRLYRVLRNCENHMSTENFEACKQEYITKGHLYEDLVSEIVQKAKDDLESLPNRKRILLTPKASSEEVPVPIKVEAKGVISKPVKKLKKKIGLVSLD